MSRRGVHAYHWYSRTLIPLFAVYVAGQAIGRAVYVATGHLGLFGGPLGELKRAFLGSPGRHPLVHPEDVLAWLPVVLFGYFVVVEWGRQARRRQDSREALFLVGITLTFLVFAAPTVGLKLGWRVDDGLVTLGAIAAGAALVASRWARWQRRKRALAALVGGTGFVLGLVLLRMHDTVQLGSPW